VPAGALCVSSRDGTRGLRNGRQTQTGILLTMLDNSQRAVVCGGGGFIGGHLVGDLIRKGHKHVRCVDVKPKSEWYQVHGQAENVVADLNLRDAASNAV